MKGELLRGIVIPDVHVPMHHGWALEVICKYLETVDVFAIHQGGDLCDISQMGKFTRTRDKLKRVVDELKTGAEVLATVYDAADAQYESYDRGNHEDRWWKHTKGNAPELDGMLINPYDVLFPDENYSAPGMPWNAEEQVLVVESYKGESGGQPSVLRYDETSRDGLIPRRWFRETPAKTFGLTVCHGFSAGLNATRMHAERMLSNGPLIHCHTHKLELTHARSWGPSISVMACGHLVYDFQPYENRPVGNHLGFGEWAYHAGHFVLTPRPIAWDGCVARLIVDGKVFESRRKTHVCTS